MPNPPITNTAQTPVQNTLTKKQQQTRGSGFTNINSILDANKGAGQKMGQQIGGQLNQQADSVRAGIQSSQNQFQQQKNQAGQQANQAVQAGQNLTRQAGETDDAYNARLAQGNQNFSQIGQNLRAAEYQGPMGLQNAGKLQAQGATASALGRLAGNTQGQTELLRSMVARPGQYTAGQSALDSLLLGTGGQNAIQQGRRAAIGLEDKAMGAANQAEVQANALKSGIASNRAKTLADLQNAATGDTGVIAQGTKAAQQFQQDANQLSQLLSGQWVPQTPEEKAKAEQLVNNMGEFGLEDYALYNEDPNAVNAALSQLGGSLTQDFGSKRFNGNLKQAGLNLADVLADKDLRSQIENNKFNTDVFGKESDIFRGLDTERTKDIGNRDRINAAAQDFKADEDKMQQYVNSINANWTPTGDFMTDQIHQQMVNAAYGPTQDLLNKYGYFAWGDVNPDNDPRIDASKNQFSGLGITGDPTQAGRRRTSQSLINAANQQVKGDQQLKNLILKRILGQ